MRVGVSIPVGLNSDSASTLPRASRNTDVDFDDLSIHAMGTNGSQLGRHGC